MHLKLIAFAFCVLLVIQCNFAAAYKSEIEITPAPPEEATTKKSGFFGGIKSFFRGSATTTTTPLPMLAQPSIPKNEPAQQTAVKPPPLVIPPRGNGAASAPLMPLGPRPDTPPSSPLAGGSQQPPQWPQPGAPTMPNRAAQPTAQQQPTPIARPNAGQPNLPPGFQPYHPTKPLPSGVDLSYGGGGRPQHGGFQGGRPGLAPLTSSTTTTSTTTTTTTTTPRPVKAPQSPTMDVDLRGSFDSVHTTSTTKKPTTGREDFPALPAPRRPSIKEDFPALPTPKTPAGSPTPSTPLPASPTGPRPSSPSAWATTPTPGRVPQQPQWPPKADAASTPPNRVSFVPKTGTSTTARPGPQQSGSRLASDDEIRELTELLYTKEGNSQLNLVRVNAQGKTRSIDSTDEAPQPLLEVDAKVFDNPTIAKMRALFNNYEGDTMVNEHVTANERKEENDFVDAVMATSVMRQAMLFLQNKGIVSPDPKTHRDLVKELWFTQYSRGNGKVGSSGFEHVFVNEVKNGTIIGLHNWVYFHDEEQAGHLDYKGYMNALDMGTKGKVMKVRFTHNGLNKPVNTMFIGTSPELELALYTVCFKVRPDVTCPVSLGNNRFGVITYSWRYRGKSLIGSAYPEI